MSRRVKSCFPSTAEKHLEDLALFPFVAPGLDLHGEPVAPQCIESRDWVRHGRGVGALVQARQERW